MVLSTVDRRTNFPSELILNLLLVRRTWANVVGQKTLLICARISFTKIGGSYVGLCMLALVLLMFSTRWLVLCTNVSRMFTFTRWSMAKSVSTSSSSGLPSLPVTESRDSASMACYFILAR